MPKLDIPTLSVICVFLAFTYSMGLYLVQRLQPNVKGVKLIALALFVLGIGFILLSFGNSISLWLSKIVANTLILFSFILILHGVCLLRGYPSRLANIGYYSLPIIITGLTYFTYFSQSTDIRISLVTFFIVLFTATTIYANHKGRAEDITPSKLLLSAGLLIQCAYSLLRFMLVPFQEKIPDFMLAGGVHQLAFITMITMIIFVGFSISWLLTGRLVATIYDTSLKDELTKLYNRRALEEFAEKEAARSQRFASPLTFVLLDIDHFKEINDNHGHQTGDQVLESVGRILTIESRRNDFGFRYGGEEFLVILPETNLQQAGVFAEKIRKLIEKARILPNNAEFCTASFGLSKLARGECWHDAIARADKALYQAKNDGRNRVVVSS